jgi:hypothetical protein
LFISTHTGKILHGFAKVKKEALNAQRLNAGAFGI